MDALSPRLFYIYLCAIFFLVRDCLLREVEIDYRLDWRLFNPSCLNAKTNMTTAVIDLQYDDDCAIIADTAQQLQTSLDILTESYQILEFYINIR